MGSTLIRSVVLKRNITLRLCRATKNPHSRRKPIFTRPESLVVHLSLSHYQKWILNNHRTSIPANFLISNPLISSTASKTFLISKLLQHDCHVVHTTIDGHLPSVVSYKLIKSLKAYRCGLTVTLRYTFSAVIFTYACRTVKRDPPYSGHPPSMIVVIVIFHRSTINTIFFAISLISPKSNVCWTHNTMLTVSSKGPIHNNSDNTMDVSKNMFTLSVDKIKKMTEKEHSESFCLKYMI